MRADDERMRDMLDAIDSIGRHLGAGRAAFDASELLRVWCLHHIAMMGEAASRLSPEFRARHPDPPWRALIGMRNALVHGYFQVDWDSVWVVVERDLIPPREALLQAMEEEGWES